ncbi:MAG: three-Cys-motif partner protein TcmP [Burkholderiales bacterium]|nr:three-Cys-motif partner protein TcmP [Burkholderiales bacterium]
MKKPARIDTSDGLPVAEVGEWSVELKHRLLREYVDATWGVRSKYQHRGYVDLFSGPGRVEVKTTGQIVDGSSLIAWRASAGSKAPYTSVIVADSDRESTEACDTRLKRAGCMPRTLVGEARETSRKAAAELDRFGLHLVFLDPYNLKALPFSVFEAFFERDLRHVDFIVHFSANDLQRNLDSFLAEETSIMDDFVPGWRAHVTMRARDQMRGTTFWYWVSLFEKHGFQIAKEAPLIRGGTRQPLYWLVLLSRHPLAANIWNSVADKSPQGSFGF